MINIIDKSKCCACNACVQTCPKTCISMHTDDEGFYYPKVDLEKCIDCKLCERVCPFKDIPKANIPIKTLGAKNIDLEQRLLSSSGAVFTILGEYVLSHNGVVFGATYDEAWNVTHTYAESSEDLRKFVGSKYVQSEIRNSFKSVEKFLKEGRLVLFTGTPCQVKGLKKYLRHEFNNLITTEIVCHGVPSSKIWGKFKSEIHLRDKINEISQVNFRAKQLDGYCWQKYGMVIKGNGGETVFSKEARSTVYFKLFLSDLILRPSCYVCNAKNGASGADITLGDFWGINNVMPDFADDMGISLMLIHSQKGQVALKDIQDKLEIKETTFEEAISQNPSYVHSVKEPKERRKFWSYYYKTQDLEQSLKVAVYPPYALIIVRTLITKIKEFIFKG